VLIYAANVLTTHHCRIDTIQVLDRDEDHIVAVGSEGTCDLEVALVAFIGILLQVFEGLLASVCRRLEFSWPARAASYFVRTHPILLLSQW
jgi:hypothetical protein